MITSGDLDRAKAVARRIRTGTLGLNGGIWYGADAPFGGYKQSGIGRQCGIEGLEIFTETKTVGWPVPNRRSQRSTERTMTCQDHSTASRSSRSSSWMFMPSAGGRAGRLGRRRDQGRAPRHRRSAARAWSPRACSPAAPEAVNFMIEQPNHGKRSVGIDITHPDGREVLMKLVETADVFLTNYLPHVRRKLQHRHRRHPRSRTPTSSSPAGSGTGHQGSRRREGRLRRRFVLGPRRRRRGRCPSAERVATGTADAGVRRRHGWPLRRGCHRCRASSSGSERARRAWSTSRSWPPPCGRSRRLVVASKLFGFSKIPQGDRTQAPNPGRRHVPHQ